MADANAGSHDNLSDHALSDEQRTALENLLKKQALNGAWGYKSVSDPIERDVVFRSEATAENIFAVLYADNPDNARVKWQSFTGKSVDQGLISRTKNFVVDRDKAGVIEKLTSQQTNIQDAVDEVRSDKNNRNRQQRLAQLQSTLGDAKQRQMDNKQRAQRSLTETDSNIDGLSVIKCFFKGGKIANEYRASRNDKKKAAWLETEISEVMREKQEKEMKTARMRAVGPEFEPKSDSPVEKAAASDGIRQHIDKMAGLKGANMARAVASAPKKFADLLRKPSEIQHQSPPQQQGFDQGRGL